MLLPCLGILRSIRLSDAKGRNRSGHGLEPFLLVHRTLLLCCDAGQRSACGGTEAVRDSTLYREFAWLYANLGIIDKSESGTAKYVEPIDDEVQRFLKNESQLPIIG